VLLARFFGRYTSNHVGAKLESFLNVERRLRLLSTRKTPLQYTYSSPRKTLAEHLRVLVNTQVLNGISIAETAR
jgi:hypothetical protein